MSLAPPVEICGARNHSHRTYTRENALCFWCERIVTDELRQHFTARKKAGVADDSFLFLLANGNRHSFDVGADPYFVYEVSALRSIADPLYAIP